MALPRFVPEERQELHDLAAQWPQIVSKRTFGNGGPGLNVDFRPLQQIATTATQGPTEGTFHLPSQQQAQRLTSELPCGTVQCRASGSLPRQSPGFFPRERYWGWMNTVVAPLSASESAPRPHGSPRSAVPPTRFAWQTLSSARAWSGGSHIEVGAELVERRDRKVVSRRRRELSARVAVIPDAVALGGTASGVHAAQNKDSKRISCVGPGVGVRFFLRAPIGLSTRFSSHARYRSIHVR
ncbi:hypothetical protein VT84_07610 [Gemmata sp. SH-PL17]|nr:hypothetical protein VT84_07610 [Gemmata sp. SH-PL17]